MVYKLSEAERNAAKAVITPIRQALYNYDEKALENAMEKAFAPTCKVRLGFPFEDLGSPKALLEKAYKPLKNALSGLERRDTIVMAGLSTENALWVGCCGQYVGSFVAPFLDIPPTGHLVTMRFHDFYRIEQGKVVDFQSIWDIPELMHQAGVWPLSPQLGRAWYSPAPATQDGLAIQNHDENHAHTSLTLVGDMLTGLSKFAEGGVEAMNLAAYWHPGFCWYGPYGIGTSQGISGFRNWHQIPFLNAMPDRRGTGYTGGGLFADGDYVGIAGWPNMEATISHDGWLGIAASDQKITLRSLDFWRCENGLIRENWVLVDLLSMYDQIGIDVFARMREFNKASTLTRI